LATESFANSEILVNTEWLNSHIDDLDIRIIDCDMFDSYARAHIKGAVGIKVHHYIKHPSYSQDSKSYPLVAEPDVVKELFESMGIGDDTTVVSYDSAGSLSASRFWWVLNYYGHKNAKVLDGGWKKWFDEGRPVSIEPPSPREVTFTPSADETLICTLDQAVSKIDDSDVVFLDVRSDGEWDGTNSRGNSRSGRVPGSVHLEWLNFITDDKYHTIKSPSELRDMLKTVGVTPEKEVITY
jgi:thiosulfate/3-mercaptopyruvate sulfurtransferase